MDTSKMREQFEAALIRQAVDDGFAKPSLRRNKNNGDYVDPFEQAAWWGWQASREAVVVELPELRSVPDRDCWARSNGLGFNNAVKESRQMIEAQGLKVAP